MTKNRAFVIEHCQDQINTPEGFIEDVYRKLDFNYIKDVMIYNLPYEKERTTKANN